MLCIGKAIADASLALGVHHLVYSSTDFGGLDDTGVSAFEAKRAVETHIRQITSSPSGTPMGWTFLRPVQFMENFVPTAPFLFKMSRTVVLRYTFYKNPERKHQLIAVRDIGRAAALAFVNGPGWLNGVVRLAGDGLTTKQIDQVFKEVRRQDLSSAPNPVLLIRCVQNPLDDFLSSRRTIAHLGLISPTSLTSSRSDLFLIFRVP